MCSFFGKKWFVTCVFCGPSWADIAMCCCKVQIYFSPADVFLCWSMWQLVGTTWMRPVSPNNDEPISQKQLNSSVTRRCCCPSAHASMMLIQCEWCTERVVVHRAFYSETSLLAEESFGCATRVDIGNGFRLTTFQSVSLFKLSAVGCCGLGAGIS